MDIRAKIVIALVEAVALVIGLVCWHFGIVAWYIVPLFLLIPPLARARARLRRQRERGRREPIPVTPAEPAEAEFPCDLCSTLWPEGALENGVCPDCLDEAEEPA